MYLLPFGMANLQYDYDFGPTGPLAALQDRSEYPETPSMISPPVGWVDIVVRLDAELASILPDYTIVQVKEKFAGLRYYIGEYGVGRDDPRIAMSREMIASAEQESMRTCQVCGEPGRYREGHAWMRTVCDEHDR